MQGNKEWGYRSSVWVNQEISMLAYRKQFEGVEIPILVFKDERVRLEGAMTSLIVNPIPMKSESEILEQVKSWLESTEFLFKGSNNDDRFFSKWAKLPSIPRKVISALLDEGGTNVKEFAIKACLQENYGMGNNEASQAILEARLAFINTDLIKLKHDINSGDEMSINPTWQWHIAREMTKLSDSPEN